jgi:hypothetical protein
MGEFSEREGGNGGDGTRRGRGRGQRRDAASRVFEKRSGVIPETTRRLATRVVAEAAAGDLSVLAFPRGGRARDVTERRADVARARIAIRGRTDDGAHRTSRGTDDEHVRHLVFHSRCAGTFTFTPPARR